MVSEFNLENTTVYNSAEEASDENGSLTGNSEAMEVDSDIKIEADKNSLSVDYALYAKFWQLQDFFRVLQFLALHFSKYIQRNTNEIDNEVLEENLSFSISDISIQKKGL